MTSRSADFGSTPVDAFQVEHVHPPDTILHLGNRSDKHSPSSSGNGDSPSTNDDVPGQRTRDNLLGFPLGGNITYQKTIRPKPASTATSSISTARSSCSSDSSIHDPPAASAPSLPPKIGTRFSKESARVLRQWLDTHKDHPFPSRDDMEMLQRFTGLSNVQVKTWFANARRRRKLPTTRASSLSKSRRDGTKERARPDTPIPRGARKATYDMDPMERWFDSPPEDEPASVGDIARAVSSGCQPSVSGKGRLFPMQPRSDTTL